ncbi:MBG domain-containing protein [Filimonas effusa]|uniref:T9SS type B sorting domain-containing protein n=1 Tax=Filimonas effusa TaxID=2508721 RepID=A0A4Q1D3E9_9BACT|nr:MBG domain-containing protein [Filimonas effusa]RXK82942.1 T9SS type B sorting domain-containing protein [Filimonas effusa]
MNLRKKLLPLLMVFVMSFCFKMSYAHSGGVWIANDGCGHWFAIVFHYHNGSSASSISSSSGAGLYFDYNQNGVFDVNGGQLAYTNAPGQTTSNGEFTRFSDYIVFSPAPTSMTANAFANNAGIQQQVLNWLKANKNYGKDYTLSVAIDGGTRSSVWYEALVCPIQPISPGKYKASTSTSSDVETPTGGTYVNPFELNYTPTNFNPATASVGQQGYKLDINTTLTQTCVAEYGWIYSTDNATPTVNTTGVVKNVVSTVLKDYNNEPLALNISVPAGSISKTYYIRSYYKQTVNGQDFYVYSAVTSIVPVPAPVISQQAGNKSVCTSSNTSLSLTATIGQGSISYQWQVNIGSGYQDLANSAVYDGVNSNQLSITGATLAMSGYKYRCILTSSVNATVQTTSDESVLTVNGPVKPTVTDVTYNVGATPSPLSNSVSASGSLLWYTAATGGSGSATAPPVSTANPGVQEYWVTQTASSCESERAKITVLVRKNVVAVSEVTAIEITYGDALNLPTSVFAVYDNNTIESTPVTWNTATYSGKAGNYTITGTLNLTAGASNTSSVKPSVNIKVNKKTVTGVLQGYVTKTYDATVTAKPLANNYRLEGLVTGDNVLLNNPATGTYDNKNVGSAKIVTVTGLAISGTDKDNYVLASTTTSATVGFVNPAGFTVTARSLTKTYDGVGFSDGNGYDLSGFVGGESITNSDITGTVSYTGNAQGAKNWGYYNIYPTGLASSNYSIYFSPGTLTINKRALAITASNQSKTYGTARSFSGSEFTQTGLVVGETITTTITSNATPANAAVATYPILISNASGSTIDNYTVSYTNGSFSVGKKDLTITAKADSKDYDRLAYSGGNGVTYSGFISGESETNLGGTLSYGGTAQGAKNGGSYLITPRGYTSGNYNFIYIDGALTINKVSLNVKAKDETKNYDGTSYSNGNGITYTGFINGDDAASLGGVLIYTGNSQGAKNVGTYVITPSGYTSANYTITYGNGSLVINKARLTIEAKDLSRAYNGNTYSGGNGITATGFANGETVTNLGGTLTYSGNSQGAKFAGTYNITPGGYTSGNYDIVFQNGTLSITKVPLTITAAGDVKVYDGNGYSGGKGVTYSGFVGTDNASSLTGTVTYSGNAQGARNVGSYDIMPAGITSSNAYDISFVKGTLVINKADLVVTAKDIVKSYDGIAYTGGGGVNFSGMASSDNAASLGGTLAYGGTARNAKNAGTYVITPSGYTSGNYNISYANGNLTINKTALEVRAKDASKTYDALAYSGGNGVEFVGLASGESAANLAGTLTFGGAAQGAKTPGTYVITPGGYTSGNYNISFTNGTLTIGKAILRVTAKADSKNYDGRAYTGGNGVTYSGFATGEMETVLGGSLSYSGDAQGAVNGGSYVIAPGGYASGNYDIQYSNGVLTVNKLPLTVTAHDDSKVYDGIAYTGGNAVSYSGFLEGEDENVLRGTLAYGGNAQGATNAGSYQIAPSGYVSDNYAFNYVSGNLAVTKAALTVTAKTDAKTYDGIAYAGGKGVLFSGFVNNENESVLGGILSYAGTSQGAKAVGEYDITPGGYISGNYEISFASDKLSINKATLLVTAKDATKEYDGIAYTGGNGVSYNGFVTGDDATVLGGTLSYSGTSQGAKNGGRYLITPGGYTSGNYNINYANGQLTVTKKELTVTAEDKSKYSGMPNPDFTVIYNGFAANDSKESLAVQPIASSVAATSSPAGTYSITVAGGASDNYFFTYVPAVLTVKPGATTSVSLAAVTVYENQAAGTKAGDLSSVSENPGATFTYSLVTGSGDTDNTLFAISGSQLRTTAALDYEQKNSFSVRVRSTTQFGVTFDKVFTLSIQDVNEAPQLNQPAAKTLCYTKDQQTVALSGINAGPEVAQTTTLSVQSDNAGLFEVLQVTGSGTTGNVRFIVKDGASGSANVTVTVQDNGGTANGGVDKTSKTFRVVVNPLPVFTIASEKGNSISLGVTTRLIINGASGSVNWSPATGLDYPLSFSPNARPMQSTTYTATVTSYEGCVSSQQIAIDVREDFQAIGQKMLITPNGDGINDFFVLDNLDAYPNNRLQVFDRAGKTVYERRNYDNSWNGTLNNKPLVNGTYFYVLTVNNQVIRKGTVTIVN